MRYFEAEPSADLAPAVERDWFLEAPPGPPNAILPDGHCELVARIANPLLRIAADGSLAVQPEAVWLVNPAPTHAFGIRFTPQGAWLATGTAQSPMRNR